MLETHTETNITSIKPVHIHTLGSSKNSFKILKISLISRVFFVKFQSRFFLIFSEINNSTVTKFFRSFEMFSEIVTVRKFHDNFFASLAVAGVQCKTVREVYMNSLTSN